MTARNDVKTLSNLNARRVLTAVRLRVAERIDTLVAGWLARCASNIEATQWVFETDRKPARAFGVGHGAGRLNATLG